MKNTVLIIFGLIAGTLMASAEELRVDQRRDALTLAGEWELLLEHGNRDVWDAAVSETLGPWKSVSVPGSRLMSAEKGEDWPALTKRQKATTNVWLRSTFELGSELAARQAVLKWGGIRFGATAWVNGVKVTEYVPVGPHTVLLPHGLLRTGENAITLKIPGWQGVAKSQSGYPLTPTGGATQRWGAKWPAVYQEIWLEFFEDAYLRHVLAMPDVAKKTVDFRFELEGLDKPRRPIIVTAEVLDRRNGKQLSTAQVALDADATAGSVTCSAEGLLPWTPESPQLYDARIRARIGDKICDDMRFTFGMRTITVRDGHFSLNGRPLWLRGSNLVNEWLSDNKFNENVKSYMIDEARSMNLNSFRTHTQPPPTLWLDTADEHGMMMLVEMPLLYNHADFKYTPDEFEILHKNAMLDAEGWITKLWNHPSVVMWVLSNESIYDNQWESGPYFEYAKALDPTRLYMRTGDEHVGTPDMVDVHTCFNVALDGEGELHVRMAKLAAVKDPKRPLTNTEYMNHMWDPAPRWLGSEEHPDMPLAYAECALEHTEVMRRLKLDCLLPYMYANWTRLRGKMNWRDDYPTPMAAALHSAMSPVLASLDLFDRNVVAGETVDIPIVLINEKQTSVSATLDLYVTPKHPLFIPEPDSIKAARWHESRKITFAANEQRTIQVQVPLPGDEGSYYLAAVLTHAGDSPIVSQRVIRAVRGPSSDALNGRRVVIFGVEQGTVDFLERHGCKVSDGLTDARVEGNVVLIGDVTRMSEEDRRAATGPLRAFAEQGGSIVVLDQQEWPWKELADCEIGLPKIKSGEQVRSSRAHAYTDATHPALRGIPADWLWRWNGLPGEIVSRTILGGAALEQGQKILWASRPEYTALLNVPMGKGAILFSQLRIRERLGHDTEKSDPVARRMLVNMISE